MANEIIRPSELPTRAIPVASEVVPSDNASTVAGVSWLDGVNSAVPPASQPESEAGVINSKRMTPLTTKQAIDAQVPPKISSAIGALNLGTASQSAVEDFATTSQGTKADSALQPADIGDTVQSHGAFLDALAGMTPGSDGQVIAFDSNGDPVATDAGAGDMLEVVYDPDANEANAFDLSNQYGNKPTDFATVADLLADASLGYSAARRADQVAAGMIVNAQGFRYEVAASGDTDHHVETAGGVKLYVLREQGRYNVSAWGVISDSTDGTDGTDQTAGMLAIVAQMNAAGYRGELYVPYGTKFNKLSVYGSANPGILFIDDSLINWYNSPTYKTKIRNIYSSDLGNDDTSHMFSSGHHPTLFLNNFGTAGSGSASGRYATILYGAGVKPDGEYMTGLYEQASGIGGQWAKTVYLQTPFDIASKVKAWQPTTAYGVGDIVEVWPGNRMVYECTVAGTSGTVAPSHTAGTATDGTVTWAWKQNRIEINGATLWRVYQNGSTVQLSSLGDKSASHQISIVNSAYANYSATIEADAEHKTTSITTPSNGYVNLGKSGAPTDLTTAGFSVFNGSGGDTAVYLMNGRPAGGGTSMVLGSVAAAASTFINFRYNGGSATGSITHNGSGTTAYNTSSDARLKTNARDFDSGEIIDALEMWQYDWTHGRGGGFGVMAQDAHEVFPDAVTVGKGELDDDDFEPWSVDYSKFVPLLLRECQQLRRRVAELEKLGSAS